MLRESRLRQGRRLKWAPNRDKMWDNFARLTARLAKSCVLFINSTIYLDFSTILSRIVPNRPLNEGRPLGATSWLSRQRYATALSIIVTSHVPLFECTMCQG